MKIVTTFKNFFKMYFVVSFIIFSGLVSAQINCPEGMVAYWKFDEVGGVNIFLDSSGDNDASCSQGSCPSGSIGIFNRARNFNGSNEVIVPDDIVFDWGFNTSFTIEAWVNTTEPGTGNKVFIGKYRGGSVMTWWFGYGDNNKAIFDVKDSDGIISQIEGTTEINDGNWHHVVGVRNNNLLQIFVDGVKENEISTFFTGDFSGSEPVYIGYYIGNYHYNGLLDEVAVYDTALSEDIISNHYNNMLSGMDYCDNPTAVEEEIIVYKDFELYQNYPNPFNPSTKIKFSIPHNLSNDTMVKIKIYDIIGNEVASLVNEEKPAGVYEVEFSAIGVSASGGDIYSLSSGIYFYKIQAGDFIQTRKMIFVK